MCCPALMRLVLCVGVLMVVILLPTACGSGSADEDAGARQGGNQEEQARNRPLPQDPAPLSPGEYHSVEFGPSLTFTVGRGWLNTESQLPDFIEVGQPGETGWISFANVKEVFKPGTLKVVEAPHDMVGWFQKHPYLKTSKPQRVTVGGVEGEQIDMVLQAPEDYYGQCGLADCMDIWILSTGETAWFHEGNKMRIIFLEVVKGKTVTIDIGSPAGEFDEYLPEAKNLVDTVKWGGS